MIMEVIRELAKAKTILLISHRLANVVESDRIYMLENGGISVCDFSDYPCRIWHIAWTFCNVRILYTGNAGSNTDHSCSAARYSALR